MKGYVVCVWEKINSEEKLQEYALKAKIAADKYSGIFICLLYTSPSPRD